MSIYNYWTGNEHCENCKRSVEDSARYGVPALRHTHSGSEFCAEVINDMRLAK